MHSSACVLLFQVVCISTCMWVGRSDHKTDGPVKTKVLEVLFVNSYCSHENFDSRDVYSSVEVAVGQLNSSLSHEWVINLTEGDMQVSPLDAVLQSLLVYNRADLLAIVVPGCSKDAQFIAEVSHTSLFDTVLLTFAFSELDTAQLWQPNHFRMIPREHHLATAVAAVVNNFHWKRMVLFTQSLPVFSTISSRVHALLDKDNISVTNVDFLEDTSAISFPDDNRIFVLNMYPAQAKEVLCQAYHLDMMFPDYVWITYGWYSSEWWRDSNLTAARNNCTHSEIKSMLVGSIALSHYVYTQQSNVSSNSATEMYSTTAADAVVTVFNALKVGSDLKDSIKKTSFTGESGPISFENASNMRAIEHVSVFQYRQVEMDFEMASIASVMVNMDNLSIIYDDGVSVEDIWEGEIPADGTPMTELHYPLLSMMIICYSMATAGIIFSGVCFIFNIAFRKKRLIRLTSPTINFVIILGAVLLYLSVYTFYYLPDTHKNVLVLVCNVRLWLTSIGFSLCFIPINVKMWRVYHISRKPSLKKAVIRDWHLLLFILMFLVIDLLLLGVVTAIDSSRYTVAVIPDKEHPGTFINERGFTVSFEVNRCYSATEVYWLLVVFGYKFLLQAVAVYLAFNIRKVKIKGLNDSREVSIILYITSVVLVIVVLETFIFGDYINVDGGVYGFGISIATSIVLGFIFIPKMYGLYKDPKGENIFLAKSPSNFNSGTVKSHLGSSTGNSNAVSKIKAVNPLCAIEVTGNDLKDCNSLKVLSVSESSNGEVGKGAEESSCE